MHIISTNNSTNSILLGTYYTNVFLNILIPSIQTIDYLVEPFQQYSTHGVLKFQ